MRIFKSKKVTLRDQNPDNVKYNETTTWQLSVQRALHYIKYTFF